MSIERKRIVDPGTGSGHEIFAGETVEFAFTADNSNTDRVVSFEVDVTGVDPAWIEQSGEPVGPFEIMPVTVRLAIPASAAGSTVALGFSMKEGDKVLWPQPLTLTARIGAARAVAAPAPPPPVETQPEPEVAPEEPAADEPPAEPEVVETPPAPKPEPKKATKKEPKVIDLPKAVEPEPEPEPVVESEPEPEPEPEPTPEPVKPKVQKPDPVAPKPKVQKPDPAPAKPVPPKPEPTPEPVFAPDEDTLVDLPSEEEEEKAIISDRTVVNPKDGAKISARPGERIQVRFGFANDASIGAGQVERTFILQHNNELPRAWITLVTDQVNITPGGTGELTLVLSPSIDAEPALYPFTVSTGLLGQPLTPCTLILEVQPVPAVLVKAVVPSASVWFRNSAEVEVEVSMRGNADTAYRLAVRASDEPETISPGTIPAEVYEAPPWRYEIENEFGNLKSSDSGKGPAPNKHTIRLVREGIWWFGLKESRTVTVAANPVTDMTNADQPINRATVTVTRKRILPLPGFVAAPLLVGLALLLGSGASNLEVVNRIDTLDGIDYVQATEFSPVSKGTGVNVNLSWSNGLIPRGASRMDRDGEGRTSNSMSVAGRTDEVALGPAYFKDVRYGVPGGFFRPGSTRDVRILGLRTQGALAFQIQYGNRIDPNFGEDRTEDINGAKRNVVEVTVPVRRPVNPALQPAVTIVLKNVTPKDAQATTVMVTRRWPESMKLTGFSQNDERRTELASGSDRVVKVYLQGNETEDFWELLTTDSDYPILRFVFQVKP